MEETKQWFWASTMETGLGRKSSFAIYFVCFFSSQLISFFKIQIIIVATLKDVDKTTGLSSYIWRTTSTLLMLSASFTIVSLSSLCLNCLSTTEFKKRVRWDVLHSKLLKSLSFGASPGSLVVVKTSPSNAEAVDSVPHWGAKIPHASWPKKQKKNPMKQKQYCNKFSKEF